MSEKSEERNEGSESGKSGRNGESSPFLFLSTPPRRALSRLFSPRSTIDTVYAPSRGLEGIAIRYKSTERRARNECKRKKLEESKTHPALAAVVVAVVALAAALAAACAAVILESLGEPVRSIDWERIGMQKR